MRVKPTEVNVAAAGAGAVATMGRRTMGDVGGGDGGRARALGAWLAAGAMIDKCWQ